MKTKTLFMIGVVALLLASCATPKRITYFPDAKNGDVFAVANSKYGAQNETFIRVG